MACEMLVHSSSMVVRSCWILAGTRCHIRRSRASQTCSMGDTSGEYTGHAITGMLSASRNCVQILATWCIFMLQHERGFLFGSQRRWSLSLPVLTLIFPALLPCLVRDSLCTALQTKILWINWSLNAIDTIETWVSGNLTALTERSQPAIRWMRGRGGESCVWRLFPWRTLIPIRNHDNRYFADWIRLCPGLSNNSENGNSCPKPHKAARMIEAVGRAVSIEH